MIGSIEQIAESEKLTVEETLDNKRVIIVKPTKRKQDKTFEHSNRIHAQIREDDSVPGFRDIFLDLLSNGTYKLIVTSGGKRYDHSNLHNSIINAGYAIQ